MEPSKHADETALGASCISGSRNALQPRGFQPTDEGRFAGHHPFPPDP
jgi:hypothetical protein